MDAQGLGSPRLLDRHLRDIRRATKSDDVAAIGADYDGFIKPALKGLESPADLPKLRAFLVDKYDAAMADQICSKNALRALSSLCWQL